MIDLSCVDGVYLYSEVIDFRYGILSLAGIVMSTFKDVDNISHSLFLFCNRKRNQIKIIQIDKLGIWLYTRRLTSSLVILYTFSPPSGYINFDDVSLLVYSQTPSLSICII